jgi:diguanylate cyclase (GGDEF)-like protein
MSEKRVSTFEPDHIAESHRLLSDAIYLGTGSLIIGGLITAAVAALCGLIAESAAPFVISTVTLVVVIVRLAIIRRRRWQTYDWDNALFIWSAAAYLFCAGALTYWAFIYNNETIILTLAMTIYLVNAMGIGLRSFAVEKVVRVHSIALLAPVTVAFILKGGYFYIAALFQIFLFVYVYTSAGRLRGILLSEITYRRRSETVVTRFRFAIDNMSHGMCMIDSQMRIVVSNAELAETFGLPGSRSLQGTRFNALVRLARQRGTLSQADANRLIASFEATNAPDSVARLEAPGPNGRVYDLTLKRHDEGGWVLVVQDVTDQRRAREALDIAARFDSMTNLPNRRSFEERLSDVLAAARGRDERTEVLFLDLDGFKQINDTLGHKFGDRVLAESACRLRETIGAAYASRWGGDEFVIMRSGTDDEATMRFAQALIAELSRPIWIEGAEVVVGASVGAAICVGGAIGMDALLQQADMALYAAKRESRGSCRLYELSMSEQAHERRLLELDLQAALAARTFELHYQPIVDIETGELVSFEALARWRHPARGAVSPDVFVRVLEDLNLMNAFGSWALQRACEDAAKWPIPVRVGVNVSTRQIETLGESVRRALAVSGLDPGRLELEITETAALATGDTVRRTLEQVRALGVRIALDDFGTGYSSLSHLMQLPLDKVKIDKTFTQQLGRSRKADVLVANIARISSQLGMRVTFEGVETTEQLDRARALGVPAEGQGWLFGKPAAATDLDRIFAMEAEQAVA